MKKMKPGLLIASISLIGLEMGISAGIGVAIGLYLDGKFDTSPWLLMLFLFIGLAAGFRRVYEVAKKLGDEDRKDAFTMDDDETSKEIEAKSSEVSVEKAKDENNNK